MTRKPIEEKIESLKTEIQQLENHRKQLVQQQKEQERKARTKRLCKRAGLLESLLPETITLTDEQFDIFLKRTIANDYGRGKLAEITGHTSSPSAPKTAHTPPNGGTGGKADGGENERRGG